MKELLKMLVERDHLSLLEAKGLIGRYRSELNCFIITPYRCPFKTTEDIIRSYFAIEPKKFYEMVEIE